MVHTGKDLIAHRKDRATGGTATYSVRPRRQDPPTARPVFGLDIAGTRYTGEGKGWLLVELEPGRYRAVGRAPDSARIEYPTTEILAWDEAEAVLKRNQHWFENTAPR